MTGPRVVLGEDDVLLREGLASPLDRSGFEVAGLAGDGPRLLTLVREAAPDLVVTDIRMPPSHTTEGLEAARCIRQEMPSTAIVVLSAYAEVEHAMELLASGRGIGYLLKSRVTDVVLVGVIGFAAALIGDNIGFAIGHYGGRAVTLRWGRYVGLIAQRLDKAEGFFQRHGGLARIPLGAGLAKLRQQPGQVPRALPGQQGREAIGPQLAHQLPQHPSERRER
jgi:CheY-like chemotaxis protein